MKKYYIIREDGTSLFALPYQEDFIYHCLIKLLDITDEKFRLLSFLEAPPAQEAPPSFNVSILSEAKLKQSRKKWKRLRDSSKLIKEVRYAQLMCAQFCGSTSLNAKMKKPPRAV